MSKVCQLFSGSSGNSILISGRDVNILVDIGVSAKKCGDALREIDVDPNSIDAIFVTHEHIDHVAGVRVFSERHDVPVFASPASLEEMYLTGKVNNRTKAHEIRGVLDFNDIFVEPFKLSHDSVDCLGYKFTMPDNRKICVCTDTGYITDQARETIHGSDLVFLESNHEPAMLDAGNYPYMLKKRIMSQTGHLSNSDCGIFAKELLESGTTRIVLSHLSKENNMPSVARQTTVSALGEIGAVEGKDYRLLVSAPQNEGRCTVL